MKTAKLGLGLGMAFIGLALIVSDAYMPWMNLIGCAVSWVGVCIVERGYEDI